MSLWILHLDFSSFFCPLSVEYRLPLPLSVSSPFFSPLTFHLPLRPYTCLSALLLQESAYPLLASLQAVGPSSPRPSLSISLSFRLVHLFLIATQESASPKCFASTDLLACCKMRPLLASLSADSWLRSSLAPLQFRH